MRTALAGRWKHYPLGFFETPEGVDEARAWAISDATAEGFGNDAPEVTFIPKTSKYLNGPPGADVVGWRVVRES